MRTGIHLGLGQGYERALAYAKGLGCTTVQVFTHSPRMFSFKPLDEARQGVLRDGWKALGIDPVVSHASYLINIGTTDSRKFHSALAILRNELTYAEAFGCSFVVYHVGKHLQATVEEGIRQVVKGIMRLQETLEETGVMLLLEIAAGQGTEFGRSFEELQQVLDGLPGEYERLVGVCLDTCHLYAGGYDIGKPEEVLAQIDGTFGMGRVKVVHVNDSKFPLGGRRDRHENLGRGHIGLDGLRAFCSHPRIRDLPLILETPMEGQEQDLRLLNSFL